MGFLGKLLGVLSGGSGVKLSDQLLFDKIIGFKGVVPGVGTSTVVQNVAEAISHSTKHMICVVDMSILFPTQYSLLVGKTGKENHLDFMDFSSDIKDITVQTNIPRVRLLSFHRRTIRDMISTKDTANLVIEVFSQLKSYFDVVLVDLSHEPTNLNTQAAVSCNKIVYVTDPSAKAMYNLQRTINMMGTLAVPPAKADRVVLNKKVPDLAVNTKAVLEDAGLRVVAELPLGIEIAKEGVVGRPAWNSSDVNKEVRQFTAGINTLADDLVTVTPLMEQTLTKREMAQLAEEKMGEEEAPAEGVEQEQKPKKRRWGKRGA